MITIDNIRFSVEDEINTSAYSACFIFNGDKIRHKISVRFDNGDSFPITKFMEHFRIDISGSLLDNIVSCDKFFKSYNLKDTYIYHNFVEFRLKNKIKVTTSVLNEPGNKIFQKFDIHFKAVCIKQFEGILVGEETYTLTFNYLTTENGFLLIPVLNPNQINLYNNVHKLNNSTQYQEFNVSFMYAKVIDEHNNNDDNFYYRWIMLSLDNVYTTFHKLPNNNSYIRFILRDDLHSNRYYFVSKHNCYVDYKSDSSGYVRKSNRNNTQYEMSTLTGDYGTEYTGDLLQQEIDDNNLNPINKNVTHNDIVQFTSDGTLIIKVTYKMDRYHAIYSGEPNNDKLYRKSLKQLINLECFNITSEISVYQYGKEDEFGTLQKKPILQSLNRESIPDLNKPFFNTKSFENLDAGTFEGELKLEKSFVTIDYRNNLFISNNNFSEHNIDVTKTGKDYDLNKPQNWSDDYKVQTTTNGNKYHNNMLLSTSYNVSNIPQNIKSTISTLFNDLILNPFTGDGRHYYGTEIINGGYNDSLTFRDNFIREEAYLIKKDVPVSDVIVGINLLVEVLSYNTYVVPNVPKDNKSYRKINNPNINRIIETDINGNLITKLELIIDNTKDNIIVFK